MEFSGFSPIIVFKYTKYPNAAREYLRFMFEREQYQTWERASFGYACQTLRAYESNLILAADPKITPLRDGGAVSFYAGCAGKAGPASAACTADFIIPNMVADVVSGQLTPKAAVARAEQRARRYNSYKVTQLLSSLTHHFRVHKA
jgi:multiple sugar transport system substrate-binding protein